MSKKIMTVCGPTIPEELGFTSMHEHVLCDSAFTKPIGFQPLGLNRGADKGKPSQ